jgi:hypothetical protein
MKLQILNIALAIFQNSFKDLKSTPLQSIGKPKHTPKSYINNLFLALLSAGALSLTSTASATLIESIAALDEGAMYRVLFVTEGKRDATSVDINDYNSFVDNAANLGSVAGSLRLNWSVLASSSTVNAQSNTGIMNDDLTTVTMFNPLGEIIATSGQDLWDGVLTAAILWNENGLQNDASTATGTDSFGMSISGATLGNGQVGSGISSATNSAWMLLGFPASNTMVSFYGVSSVVSKPMSDVPTPGTIVLMSLGLVVLSFSRYRRQS